ncbi:MAG TPA: response regulator [Acidimicrobiales bacterium]|nr:response regulator [Acidimicrobiales bacterium]
MRVRIVEDTKALAHLLRLGLEDEGHDVVTSTREFERLLTPAPWEDVDAALIDLYLPGIKGTDILRYLLDHHPEVKRVAMTASLSMADDAVGLARAVLVKPFRTADLVEALR